jgi:hypothetical protein
MNSCMQGEIQKRGINIVLFLLDFSCSILCDGLLLAATFRHACTLLRLRIPLITGCKNTLGSCIVASELVVPRKGLLLVARSTLAHTADTPRLSGT